MDTKGTAGEQRPARWNVIAVCLPCVGFLCGLLVGTAGQDVLWHGHPIDGVGWGIRTWLGFCAVGLSAAGIALARAERGRRVTVVGFILNAAPLVLVLLLLVGAALSN